MASHTQRRFAQKIDDSARSLLTVINDVLDFSKIEAGKLTLEKVDFELHEVVENAVSLIADPAHRKGLELICSIGPDVPERVRGDANRLLQILGNLVGNAVKFTEDGEVGVWVSTSNGSQGKDLIRFDVRDTGVGIPLERQDEIFRDFEQVDGSTTRKYGGTGLGLAISRQLVELMGGQIGVESSPGKGSTFWCVLPLDPAVHKPQRLSTLNSLRGRRVLIVDDNETNRTILEAQVASWGMRPDCASRGQRGLEMIRDAAERDDPFSCVILDMQMPAMDGLQTAAAVRAERSLVQPVLLLLTSALLPPDQTTSTLEIDACLEKPVRRSSLYNAMLSGFRSSLVSPPVAPEPLRSEPPVRGRILVAEDVEVNREVATMMLSGLGCDVQVAVNGKRAVELWSTGHYDLILMDCQMPELDGYEATRAIREQERSAASEAERVKSCNARVPIIALTAHAMSGDREACLAAGIDDHLSKPFSKHQLEELLDRWLSQEPAVSERPREDVGAA